MNPSQSLSDKCPNCGEVNNRTLRSCGLCGAVLPWVEAQRRAEQQRVAPQQRRRPQPLGATEWRFPAYRGAESPKITVGEVELTLSHCAALLGLVLLALSAFAPLLPALDISINLFTDYSYLAWGNLLAATIMGVALMRDELRWCYLSALMGTVSVGVMFWHMVQWSSATISPWRQLQWGTWPLVLAPVACVVGAYFVGVPEQEDTEAANPFGHDAATLFQTRLATRIKELAMTQVFQQALREDANGLKAQIQALKGLTSWEQVPQPTKTLLQRAEAELNDGWAIATTEIIPQHERTPQGVKASRASTERDEEDRKAWRWIWAVGAGVPLTIALFLVASNLLKPKPVTEDMGFLPRQEWRTNFFYDIGPQVFDYLNQVRAQNPNAPSYTIQATTQLAQRSDRRVYLRVVYTPEKQELVAITNLLDSPKPPFSMTTQDITPKAIEAESNELRDRAQMDVLEKQNQQAQQDFENSMQDLKDKLDNMAPPSIR